MSNKSEHRINALTQVLGRLRFSPPGGARGGFLLLTVFLLLAGTRYTHAQNSSILPYLSSWHQYKVTMDTPTNTHQWKIFNDLDNANSDVAEDGTNTFVLDTEPWKKNDQIIGSDAYIELYFNKTIFTAGQTWYLVYSEFDPNAGTGNCVARRSLALTMVDNSFYLTLGSDQTDCNTLDGQVLNWDDIDWLGLDHSGTNTFIPTYVDYSIKMHKAANYTLTDWILDGKVTLLDHNFNCVSARAIDSAASGTSAAGMLFTINQVTDSTFSVTVNGPSAPADPAILSDSILLRVYVKGLVYVGERVQLSVTNGVARSGTIYTVRTDDDVGKGSGDRQQVQTILPLPATQNITCVF
jgi:hypothetical protein